MPAGGEVDRVGRLLPPAVEDEPRGRVVAGEGEVTALDEGRGRGLVEHGVAPAALVERVLEEQEMPERHGRVGGDEDFKGGQRGLGDALKRQVQRARVAQREAPRDGVGPLGRRLPQDRKLGARGVELGAVRRRARVREARRAGEDAVQAQEARKRRVVGKLQPRGRVRELDDALGPAVGADRAPQSAGVEGKITRRRRREGQIGGACPRDGEKHDRAHGGGPPGRRGALRTTRGNARYTRRPARRSSPRSP